MTARTAGKYGSRAERYVHIEAGHAAQNLCLQAVALELGPGVIGALQRSEALTKDYRWTVFGVVFGIGILSGIGMIVIGMVAGFSLAVFLVAIVLGTIIATALQATAPALVYYHLRKAKESIDVEEIAAVFD